MSGFEALGSEVKWRGAIVTAGVEHFRHADGAVVARDKVWHPGAVGILAVDDTHVWLTRQPRETAGMTASLEIPAGKLDVPGEAPIGCARRELVEEIGKEAERWEELEAFYTSPGFSDERVWLFLATGLRDAEEAAEADEDERIEVIPWPLDDLDAALAESEDSKTLIALLWLARERGRGRFTTA
ncbi:MAG TPA: NUDIX hydrolase [Solirubrobacteraceae bacterium]|nr:NUDIX hydrolase [Solirubrobacteraceae bacterium]